MAVLNLSSLFKKEAIKYMILTSKVIPDNADSMLLTPLCGVFETGLFLL
jgi:hypothetical protein